MALSYFSTTRPGALSVAMNSSTTVVPLVDAASFPDPAGPGNSQYTVIIGYGSDREEVCTVTAKSGNSLTVIRGQDSTAATGKNQGDVVVHGVSARDFKGFAQTTDPRFTDSRTPTVHAPSHASSGADPLTPAAIGAVTPAQLAVALPIGTIVMWAGATAPTGWALCDGNNGTPDLRSRFIVGAGQGTGLSAYPVGTTSAGNTETVTLTEAQMPSHSHTVSGPNVAADASGLVAAGSSFFAAKGNVGTFGLLPTGGGAAHENRPPYYALSFIMKVT